MIRPNDPALLHLRLLMMRLSYLIVFLSSPDIGGEVAVPGELLKWKRRAPAESRRSKGSAFSPAHDTQLSLRTSTKLGLAPTRDWEHLPAPSMKSVTFTVAVQP